MFVPDAKRRSYILLLLCRLSDTSGRRHVARLTAPVATAPLIKRDGGPIVRPPVQARMPPPRRLALPSVAIASCT